MNLPRIHEVNQSTLEIIASNNGKLEDIIARLNRKRDTRVPILESSDNGGKACYPSEGLIMDMATTLDAVLEARAKQVSLIDKLEDTLFTWSIGEEVEHAPSIRRN